MSVVYYVQCIHMMVVHLIFLHLWGYSSGPGGIQARGLFSAIDEADKGIGEKSVYLVYEMMLYTILI